tara:strand:- start:527 stop:718 length:192 start_codon:yes stop_codon:yes gene_type:complete
MNNEKETFSPACPWHIKSGTYYMRPIIGKDRIWIGSTQTNEGHEYNADILEPIFRELAGGSTR